MDREELVNRMADAIFRLRSADRNVKSSDLARAALAVAEPAVRAGERDEIIALIEATPTPGEADDTESGHRYAAGYRDASNCAADDLRRLRDRVVARTGGTP